MIPAFRMSMFTRAACQVFSAGLLFLQAAVLCSASGPLDPKGFTEPIRVACVGDSITQGGGASPGFAYPAQLQDLLGDDWEVGNFGVSGRTLLRKGDYSYWREAALQRAQDFRPDVVIIMLGTNDTKPQNWVHFAEFAQDYRDLINIFKALPSVPRIFVCRPCPVPGIGNYGINEANIQQEIKIIDELAERLGLGLIDMHAALVNTPALLPDRVHPNNEGALVMARAVARTISGRELADSATFTRINSLFRHHAVLQRDVPLPVWGDAPAGQSVTVEFADQKVSTVADVDKHWRLTLQPLAASMMPRTLTVVGGNRITVRDLLVGDVWLASGQSNMERELGPRRGQKEITGWREAAAAADLPLIRQFYVPQVISTSPVRDAKGRWSVTTPTTAKEFTAVGFFFARDLQPVAQVPIGIIHSSWGGTPAESWMSRAALKTHPDFAEVAALQEGSSVEPGIWLDQNDPGSLAGLEQVDLPVSENDGWTVANLPATLDQLGKTGYSGVIWYRRVIDLSADQARKSGTLHLGRIDDSDTTWVNGVRVGAESRWDVDRRYSVSAGALRAGRNVVAVRFVNMGGSGGWLANRDAFRLELDSTSIRLAGEWAQRATLDFTRKAIPQAPVFNNRAPSCIYNAMIAPLTDFPIKGVLWYQGEDNKDRAAQYRTLLPALIQGWRAAWHQPALPFLVVQIAPFGKMPPAIREAQRIAVNHTSGTALVVTTDLGDPDDIHPADKAPVGSRLALAARALAYGDKSEFSGPSFRELRVSSSEAWLAFDHLGGGLVARNGPLRGFEIAGADGRFLAAYAEIRGDKVVVTSPELNAPVAVRYGWANCPDVNLYNDAGLPASPFRTDSQP
ncbi:MAG: hypothetical protein RIQ79_822 [Verrucomicrobiota bacterium]